MIERSHRETRRFITDTVYDKQLKKSNWSTSLPIVMRIHNSMKKELTGSSPAYMLYAGGINLDTRLFPTAQAETEQPLINMQQSWSEWMQARILAQRVAIDTAVDNTVKHQAQHAAEDTGLRTEFPVDSWVLKGYATDSYGKGRPSKLHMSYTGPYKVTKIEGTNYTLFDPKTGKLLEPCTIHLLKQYSYDAKRVDPLKVRIKDKEDSFLIESIQGHYGRLHKKSEVTFIVKWDGFDETTIEPWEHVRDNEILHQYLKDKGKAQLIPKKFK